jgi:hypothetical protein
MATTGEGPGTPRMQHSVTHMGLPRICRMITHASLFLWQIWWNGGTASLGAAVLLPIGVKSRRFRPLYKPVRKIMGKVNRILYQVVYQRRAGFVT